MKSDLMTYKNYRAIIAYSEEDNLFIGEVIGLTDSLNFHGRSIDELENSFHDSIENYLDLCAQIGKEPEKEFTGCFNVRTSSEIHKKAAIYAAEHGITLNQAVCRAMESFFGKKRMAR